MVGNDDGDFVAIDNFAMRALAQRSRRTSHGSRSSSRRSSRATRSRSSPRAGSGKTVAVYYYDDGHTYEKQLDGLRMIEPWLADRALLIVDDTDWNDVERATRDYLEQQPRARLLVWIPGKDNGYPAWWEGVKVLAWEADAAPTLSPAEAEAVVQLGVDPV